MKRVFFVLFLYLAVAEALEYAVLPQFQTVLSASWAQFIDVRLLATAGIVMGLLAGEMAGMAIAIVAAALAGFSQMSGTLGASLAAFTLAAWIAGRLARPLRLQGIVVRGFVILLLMLLEQGAWAVIRKAFWPTMIVETPWMGIMISVVIATSLDAFVRKIRPRQSLSNEMD